MGGAIAETSTVIEPWSPSASQPTDAADLDAIFFEASSVKEFASEVARSAFRERWLGRYLAAPDAIVFVARAVEDFPGNEGTASPRVNRIVGYVVGMLADPARDPRFDDIAYFRELAPATARYPAHLHINCDPQWRGHGVGAALIAAFCKAASARGATGVHVVTGAGMRNVGFYLRNGFREVAQAHPNGKPVVMLGREL